MIDDVIFIIASFIAAVTATLAGFGSSTLLVPVGAFFMDLKTAVFLVACFHLFNNIFKVKTFWSSIDCRTLLLFGVPSVIFAFIGARLISVVPDDALRKIVAVFLTGFSVLLFIKPGFSVKRSRGTAIAGGSCSGFLAGLIGLGGAVRAAFLSAFNLPKEIYVATSAAIALVVDLTRIPTYIFNKIVHSNSYYALLPVLFFSAYFGVKTGKALLIKIDQKAFQKIISIALFFAGIKLFF